MSRFENLRESSNSNGASSTKATKRKATKRAAATAQRWAAGAGEDAPSTSKRAREELQRFTLRLGGREHSGLARLSELDERSMQVHARKAIKEYLARELPKVAGSR